MSYFVVGNEIITSANSFSSNIYYIINILNILYVSSCLVMTYES